MTSGIFSATFISNLNSGGSGVAIFSGNTIHGGDASHYYRGKYRFDDKNQISGTIDVVKYSPVQNSVFGPIADFRLKLDGHIIVNERAFELSGHVEGQPQLLIRIALNKLDDLIEA
jgi:hypothetical protein